jgi:hypothetical protein
MLTPCRRSRNKIVWYPSGKSRDNQSAQGSGPKLQVEVFVDYDVYERVARFPEVDSLFFYQFDDLL